MATVNEHLQSASIGHAVDLQHLSNAEVRKIVSLLNGADADQWSGPHSLLLSQYVDPDHQGLGRVEAVQGAAREYQGKHGRPGAQINVLRRMAGRAERGKAGRDTRPQPGQVVA